MKLKTKIGTMNLVTDYDNTYETVIVDYDINTNDTMIRFFKFDGQTTLVKGNFSMFDVSQEDLIQELHKVIKNINAEDIETKSVLQ